jgi:hypothetical protein
LWTTRALGPVALAAVARKAIFHWYEGYCSIGNCCAYGCGCTLCRWYPHALSCRDACCVTAATKSAA